MTENRITMDELKTVIEENKIRPSQLFDEERLKADPEVLKIKDKAEAKLRKEIEAEEDNADHIPDNELPNLSLDAGRPKEEPDASDDEANHIPD